MDAFRTILVDGGGLSAIAGPIVVLLGFGAVLLSLSVARFRRTLLAGG
jgi:hypothetical protein